MYRYKAIFADDQRSLFDENRLTLSRFWGLDSNYEATGNVFNHSWYPWIIFNCNILKISNIFWGKN